MIKSCVGDQGNLSSALDNRLGRAVWSGLRFERISYLETGDDSGKAELCG